MLKTLFVLGVLANILKAGDLLLREHQKKAIQNALEILTLRLDYLKPIEWFGSLAKPRPALLWSGFSTLFVWFSWLAAMEDPSIGAQLLGGALGLLAEFLVMTLQNLRPTNGQASVLILAAFPLSAVFMWRFGSRVVRYLTGNGKLGPYFRRLLIFYFVSLTVLASAWGLSFVLSNTAGLRTVGLIFWPVLFVVIVPNTAGILMILLIPVLWLMELLLRLLRALAWRVVEYSKGAYAALILLATAGIGMYMFLLEQS